MAFMKETAKDLLLIGLKLTSLEWVVNIRHILVFKNSLTVQRNQTESKDL